MAAFSTSQLLTALTFIILFFKTLAADLDSTFSFSEFEKDPKFKSNVTLYGDAEVVNGGYAVQLSGSLSSTAGRIMYKKAIKLVEGKPTKLVSFSTYFSFSISLENADGLVFVMVPSDFNTSVFDNSLSGIPFGLGKRKYVSVEFSTLRNAKKGDFVKNNVAINVGNSLAKERNTSSVNLAESSGGKLHSWIDYEAGSKRLEVRLSEYGDLRPSEPLLWHSIDFSKLWGKEEMFVGLSPLKANASQKCYVYSWSFMVRHVPQWMHSEPLDPKAFSKNTEPLAAKPRSDCLLRVLAAMIFGTGCGALTAFVVLYLWTIFGNRRPIVPEEYVMQPIDFEYKKVNVVVEKTIQDGTQGRKKKQQKQSHNMG
ncbi:L-type lectin-domain containing receptor kinase VIII.2 [Quillaja saponaria]|uniref:L-type lectin-domain containing receptor kinase VIII.2 n=1 Tax=Quillaja saponaria TaxID=32244 RepID=A0AAD7PN48_QUISA|nr:L-type lectin-domain containing receptor kinase VIII.2 [Quillaja saponaria]